MKKTLFVIAILVSVALILGVSGFAYAQSQPPTPPPPPGAWYGPGMMGGYGYGMMDGYGYGMMGGYGMGMMMGDHAEMEQLHDYMYPALAEALGLTPEAFDARHEAGETFWDIAAAQGLTPEEAWNLMLAARNDALAQAVADGVITQEFADWMIGHMDAMYGAGYGPGNDHCDSEGYNERWGNDF